MRPFDKGQAFRAALVAACLGLSGSAAMAQTPNINLMPETKSQTPEEKERDAVADKAYRESLRKIPDKAVSDPWGDVRGGEASRAAKTAAPKPATTPKATQAKRQTKTDGAAN